jgi:hypothetical protein
VRRPCCQHERQLVHVSPPSRSSVRLNRSITSRSLSNPPRVLAQRGEIHGGLFRLTMHPELIAIHALPINWRTAINGQMEVAPLDAGSCS